MLNRDEVRNIVFSEIEKYSPTKSTVITEGMSIIEDLKITGDDDIFLISSLEKKTGIKPPNKAWRSVETVGDVIDTFMNYC